LKFLQTKILAHKAPSAHNKAGVVLVETKKTQLENLT
jgi:hypothetical protein